MFPWILLVDAPHLIASRCVSSCKGFLSVLVSNLLEWCGVLSGVACAFALGFGVSLSLSSESSESVESGLIDLVTAISAAAYSASCSLLSFGWCLLLLVVSIVVFERVSVVVFECSLV